MYEVLDDWVAFAAQLAPELPRRCQGSTGDQIRQLEELVGKPLPAVYKAYLARMGQSAGGLRVFGDGDGSLRRLLPYHQELKQFGVTVDPSFVITSLAGNRILGTAMRLADPPAPDGTIVLCVEEVVSADFLIAENLRKLLFRSCFMQFRVECRPRNLFRARRVAAGTHAAIKQTALRLGFQIYWFSDSVMLCAERGDVLLAVEELEQICSLWLVTADARQVQEIGSTFQRDHGLQSVGLVPGT